MDYGIWSRILEPPVHKTLPEEFSIRLFRENSSSRLIWKNSSSRLFRKNSSSRLVDSYGRTQLMFYLKHAVPSHSSSLLTVTVRTLSYIWHSKWDMLHVTCYMQSVMCYMWLVTCYVKARDFLSWSECLNLSRRRWRRRTKRNSMVLDRSANVRVQRLQPHCVATPLQ